MVCERLRKFLDENGVNYEVIRHGEAYTAQEVAAAMHVHGRILVKVVVLKTEAGFMMAALPADRVIDIAALRADLGINFAALASEEAMRRLFPDCEAGAMPPFGNLYGVQVCIDRTLTQDRDIVFQAGNHYEAVKMSFADFERLVRPRVMEASRKAA